MPKRSRGPAVGRGGHSPSLGAQDPRLRRTARAQIGAQDLAPPLYLDEHNRRALDVGGALFVGTDDKLRWRPGDGLEETPGSPTAARVKAQDDSIRVGKDGLRARPRSSHVTNDSDAQGVTLRDVLNATKETLTSHTETLAAHATEVGKLVTFPVSDLANAATTADEITYDTATILLLADIQSAFGDLKTKFNALVAAHLALQDEHNALLDKVREAGVLAP